MTKPSYRVDPVTSGFEKCYKCSRAYTQWPNGAADVVMALAYSYRRTDENRAQLGRHQSEQHMWSYKEQYPGPGCVADLTAMLIVALQWHRLCAEKRVGQPWGAWAVVPSSKRNRLGSHPLVDLGMAAGLSHLNTGLEIYRADLLLNGTPSDEREERSDRFIVPQSPHVQGQHVLLLEDTWVTGASAQSAALALKSAGASAVTVLCLGRWIREDGRANAGSFFNSLRDPYDPLCCPMSGDSCFGPRPPF